MLKTRTLDLNGRLPALPFKRPRGAVASLHCALDILPLEWPA